MKRTLRYTLSVTISTLIVGANLTPALASTAPGLGKATSFAVLAGETVTNTGNTVVTGDLGVSPGTAVTGFPPGQVTGAQHNGPTDPLAVSAKNDLTTAYGVAASSPCNFNKANQNLGGKTLIPGTYCQSTAPTLSGTLTLSGNGVYIFQIGSTLVTAPGAVVRLTNGAQPCNVFWQVSSSATLDTTTTFVGTIMALTSIGLKTGATLAGRALARNGSVTLDTNKITASTTCNAVSTSRAPRVPRGRAPRVPRAGAGPSQGDGFPWILAMIAGVLASGGAVGLGMGVRTRRRSKLT